MALIHTGRRASAVSEPVSKRDPDGYRVEVIERA
jgi:hypothetical protein